MNNLFGTFSGLKIVEDKSMVDKIQCKKHRKKRINKKWIKRYGFTYKPKKNVLKFGDMIVGHPETIKLIKDKIKYDN